MGAPRVLTPKHGHSMFDPLLQLVERNVEVSLFGCKMNCKTLAQKALEIFCKALDKMKALQNFLSVG